MRGILIILLCGVQFLFGMITFAYIMARHEYFGDVIFDDEGAGLILSKNAERMVKNRIHHAYVEIVYEGEEN